MHLKCHLRSTIDYRYIAVMFNTIMRANNNYDGNTSARLCTHERHSIPSPHGRAKGCLSWIRPRKITAIYRERTVVVYYFGLSALTVIKVLIHCLPFSTYGLDHAGCQGNQCCFLVKIRLGIKRCIRRGYDCSSRHNQLCIKKNTVNHERPCTLTFAYGNIWKVPGRPRGMQRRCTHIASWIADGFISRQPSESRSHWLTHWV